MHTTWFQQSGSAHSSICPPLHIASTEPSQFHYRIASMTAFWQNAERQWAISSIAIRTQRSSNGSKLHIITKKESLTREVSTGLKSTLEMIKRVQKNQEQPRDALALHATNITMPTAAQLDKLESWRRCWSTAGNLLILLFMVCLFLNESRSVLGMVRCLWVRVWETDSTGVDVWERESLCLKLLTVGWE